MQLDVCAHAGVYINGYSVKPVHLVSCAAKTQASCKPSNSWHMNLSFSTQIDKKYFFFFKLVEIALRFVKK